jgi:hypothetical protein
MRPYLLCVVCLAVCGLAPASHAQPAAANLDPADQVVGLFSATCLQFGGSPADMRGFLNQQHAPQMPKQATDAFLAGRHGQVFDVSYQTVKLALVSMDDGSCEAVAEKGDATKVLSLLNTAARENQVTLQKLAGQGDKTRPGVQQTAYGLTLGGKPMHILVSTETPAPQIVLTLVPK